MLKHDEDPNSCGGAWRQRGGCMLLVILEFIPDHRAISGWSTRQVVATCVFTITQKYSIMRVSFPVVFEVVSPNANAIHPSKIEGIVTNASNSTRLILSHNSQSNIP